MLEYTQKIEELYEDIQKRIFYMIPEKWDKLYLYASVTESLGNVETGELYFYYEPKGILRKNFVNVYEIPSKFNLDEKEYMKLVEALYNKIKELRREFKKIQNNEKLWTNLTISIKNMKFKIEYNYDDLKKSKFNSYDRHIIWRYEYLEMDIDRFNKEEKETLKEYLETPKEQTKKEYYECNIYIKNIKNIVDFETEDYEEAKNIEEFDGNVEDSLKNQILNYKNKSEV